ncbi:MAG: hypothetical protein LBD23_02095 [Oscillospiraceae bacterium]|jgi:hypothetical protein|nr:hypothetical protein [Oscillospiraceae bacterium]
MKRMQSAGNNARLQLNDGLSDEETKTLSRSFADRYDLILPDEYLTFLKMTNGFDCYPVTIFGYNSETYGFERGHIGSDMDIFQNTHRDHKIYLGDDCGNPFYYRIGYRYGYAFVLEKFESGANYSEKHDYTSFISMLEDIFSHEMSETW